MSDDPKNRKMWEEAWRDGDTPWANPDSDQALFELFGAAYKVPTPPESGRALVPLCGDSAAVRFLYDLGFQVTAIDLAPQALEKLRKGRFGHLSFVKKQEGPAEVWRADRMRLILGDIFDFKERGSYEFIYDRAALIALDPGLREAYCALILQALHPEGMIFLETVEFDMEKIEPPPFSIPEDTVLKLFSSAKVERILDREAHKVSDRMAEAGITSLQKRVHVVRK